MNPPLPTKIIPTHDLLELASLDAMGLLDADEREDFERAFRAAPPAVQAQIRREQLRFSDDSALPKVEVPLGLRARVLSAIMDRVGTASPSRRAAAPGLRPSSGVSRVWRIGAMAALAACLALGFFSVQVLNENRGLASAQQSGDLTRHFFSEYGARFDQAFFDPSTRFVQFAPAADAPDARPSKATMVFMPERRQARLYVKDLPASAGEYEVVVVDREGRESRAGVVTIKDTGAGPTETPLDNFDLENAQKLLIRLQGSARAILSSKVAGGV
jgi:hypothetical protein